MVEETKPEAVVEEVKPEPVKEEVKQEPEAVVERDPPTESKPALKVPPIDVSGGNESSGFEVIPKE